jgi:hypothetical protein
VGVSICERSGNTVEGSVGILLSHVHEITRIKAKIIPGRPNSPHKYAASCQNACFWSKSNFVVLFNQAYRQIYTAYTIFITIDMSVCHLNSQHYMKTLIRGPVSYICWPFLVGVVGVGKIYAYRQKIASA